MADLNFLNLTDCDAITFNTPTTPDLQYIEYVLGSEVKDFTNVDKYTITYSTNCCSPGITVNLPPRYQFTISPSCVFGTPTVGFDSYAIQVDNINGDLVQAVALNVNGAPASGWNYSVVSSVLSINDVQITGIFAGVANYELIITTLSGFVYTIEFTITKAGVSCDGVFSALTITYPTLPTTIVQVDPGAFATTGVQNPAIGVQYTITADNIGVIGNGIQFVGDNVTTIDALVAAWNAAFPANTVTLTYTLGVGYVPNSFQTFTLSGGVDTPTANELSFNSLIGSTTVLPGTYQIIFCEVLQDTTSTCIQNHVFIDCGTLRCQVVNKLVTCVDSNIMDFYNALVWGNDCTDTITYAEFCALYEILTIILATSGCYGKLDDCNCTDAETIANKLSPVSYPTQTNSNPCTTC